MRYPWEAIGTHGGPWCTLGKSWIPMNTYGYPFVDINHILIHRYGVVSTSIHVLMEIRALHPRGSQRGPWAMLTQDRPQPLKKHCPGAADPSSSRGGVNFSGGGAVDGGPFKTKKNKIDIMVPPGFL